LKFLQQDISRANHESAEKKHSQKRWIGECTHMLFFFLKLLFFSKDNLFLHKEVKKKIKENKKYPQETKFNHKTKALLCGDCECLMDQSRLTGCFLLLHPAHFFV